MFLCVSHCCHLINTAGMTLPFHSPSCSHSTCHPRSRCQLSPLLGLLLPDRTRAKGLPACYICSKWPFPNALLGCTALTLVLKSYSSLSTAHWPQPWSAVIFCFCFLKRVSLRLEEDMASWTQGSLGCIHFVAIPPSSKPRREGQT